MSVLFVHIAILCLNLTSLVKISVTLHTYLRLFIKNLQSEPLSGKSNIKVLIHISLE